MNITEIIYNNWIVLLGIIVILLPIIPTKFADPVGYELAQRGSPPWPQKNWTMMRYILKGLFEIFNDLAVSLSLRGSVSVVLFAVVGSDLYFNQTVSTNTVIIIIVAVIALYLEYMINNADEIEFFRIFKYKAKQPSQIQPQSAPPRE